MRGCLLFVVGVVLGVLLLAVMQIFVVRPNPLPPAAPANSDLVILFRNEFLTRELQTQLSQVKTPVSPKGLIVQAEPDQTLVLAGTAVVSGLPASIPVRIVLRPSVTNNRVAITIVQAQIGTIKLPGDWFKSFENQINDDLNRTLTNTQYRIVGVSTTIEGLLVDFVVTR